MRMAQTTSVVINCTGPYYIYGEVVVKSCILTSTHYVDVTGESLVSVIEVVKIKIICYFFFFLYIFLDSEESTNIFFLMYF